jgi:hypothetical protein
MILLDTDHFSVFMDERDQRHSLLNERMEAATEPIACTLVSVEEILRGWLALIHRLRDLHQQIPLTLAWDSSCMSWAIGKLYRSISALRTCAPACDSSVSALEPWTSRSRPLP